VSVVHCKLVTS